MYFGSSPRKLTVLLLSLLLMFGLSAPINNANAGHRHVRRYRRSRIRRHRRQSFPQRRRRYYHRRYLRFVARHYHHYNERPYPTVNNRVRRVNDPVKRDLHPKRRRETIKSIYGPKVTFKTLDFIPAGSAENNFFVQSLNVIPDGRYAFVGYGHNPALKYGRDLTKIAKVDLRHHRFHISKAFKGGHGQALAYNPVKHSLWLLNDIDGPVHQGSLEEISTNSLKPKHQLHFRLRSRDDLGDSLTFDNQDHIYNEDLIWRSTATRDFQNGMIILYRGRLNHKHVKFNIVMQGIRHAPGNVVQGIAYNPRTKRLYIEFNDVIVSLPVNRLGRLRPRDVKETILRQRREYEGISFDRQGHAYILLNDPKEIMKSTRVF